MIRLPYKKLIPEGIAHLDAVSDYLRSTDLGEKLLELVNLRVSMMNGCAYCIDLHTKRLLAAGEENRRLFALSAWRETPFFSERERAALEWAEAVTEIAETGAPDDVYARAKEHFDDVQIINLTYAIAAMNAWNRMAISFRISPK